MKSDGIASISTEASVEKLNFNPGDIAMEKWRSAELLEEEIAIQDSIRDKSRMSDIYAKW